MADDESAGGVDEDFDALGSTGGGSHPTKANEANINPKAPSLVRFIFDTVLRGRVWIGSALKDWVIHQSLFSKSRIVIAGPGYSNEPAANISATEAPSPPLTAISPTGRLFSMERLFRPAKLKQIRKS
jgi:hypothetical protein